MSRRVRSAAALVPWIAAVLAAAVPAPAGTLDGLSARGVPDDRPVTLAAPGRVVHVVFFAAWCPPCVDELERLTALEDRWAHDDYRLLVVAVPHRQTAERVARFAEGRPMPGRLLFDADGAVRAALGADGLPTHVVVGADGVEVARAGRLDGSIEAALSRLLEGARAPRRR